MNRYSKLILLFLLAETLGSQPTSSATEYLVPSDRPHNNSTILLDGPPTDANLSAWALSAISPNFDQLKIRPKVPVTVDFSLDNAGIPTTVNIITSGMSDRDRFYCEQAIWETSPFTKEAFAGKHVTVILGQTHTALNPSGRRVPRDIVLRFIPASIAQSFPSVFTRKELDEKDNLVYLTKRQLSNKRLNDFRRDWASFIAHNENVGLTRDDVLQEAAALRRTYSNLFVPRSEK